MNEAKKPVSMGIVIAAIVVVVAVAGFALMKSAGKKDTVANKATETGRTQMNSVFQQMQQKGAPVRPGYPGMSGAGGGAAPPSGMGGMPMTGGR